MFIVKIETNKLRNLTSMRCMLNLTCLFACVYAARLFHQAFIDFRKFVLEVASLPADLHVILSDICAGAGLWVFD